jgi:hypothetical protein
MGRAMDPVIDRLSAEGRARIEVLLRKGWVIPGEHPLARLHGAPLGRFETMVILGPKSSVGSHSFQLLLVDGDRPADGPLALGLYNRGPYPAYNWMELTRYERVLTVGDVIIDLGEEGLDLQLFEAISELVPRGGHLMVEYDSPSQRATERVLTLGYPEATSPTGYLLFRVGCRSYKNWHISEGWREGPRKLQGFKPWNEEIEEEKTRALRESVDGLLERPPNPQHGEWDAIARENAKAIREALFTDS